jgi:NADPH:quinone reductase-like Zn-dependent oxidoreductase
MGVWLVNRYRHTSEEERAGFHAEIARLIAAGTLYAPIHATYDVSGVKAAMAAAGGERSGKIVIAPRP